ncbi:PLDc N-terminal domain-containing protein [Candidatus Woesearchaeota archaeon]|nr:PLDc N-terminal domain-containing protein [Candidatus Woesearchaeota archaeon]
MLGQSIIGLIGLACAIWVIYDVWVKNKGLSTVMKVVWTVLAVFFSILTAIVYYFIGRK